MEAGDARRREKTSQRERKSQRGNVFFLHVLAAFNALRDAFIGERPMRWNGLIFQLSFPRFLAVYGLYLVLSSFLEIEDYQGTIPGQAYFRRLSSITFQNFSFVGDAS